MIEFGHENLTNKFKKIAIKNSAASDLDLNPFLPKLHTHFTANGKYINSVVGLAFLCSCETQPGLGGMRSWDNLKKIDIFRTDKGFLSSARASIVSIFYFLSLLLFP